MAVFTDFTGSNLFDLTNALFAPGSGINANSIVLIESGAEAVSLYDGTLSQLGIGAGLLLTSGTVPGTGNTLEWFGTDNSGSGDFYNGDADIDAVVNTVFQTQSYDATTLSFDFTVADPNASSVSFDVVFGSDEFPEWVDQFVDSAIVMVNGVNYALFNHDPNHPLSVVSANLAAGYFQDNAASVLPIEYDGVSHVLKIVAPIVSGGATNHIKIGIADTGDHIYDSGVFLANFSAGNIPGSGVVSTPGGCTSGPDSVTGSSKDEYFDLQDGDDSAYAGAGDDIIVAGGGSDSVYGGSGADQLEGDAGDDYLDGGADSDTAVYAGNKADFDLSFDGASGKYTVAANAAGGSAEGTDTLVSIEFAKFKDGLFSLDASGNVVLVDAGGPPPPQGNQPGIVFISGVGGEGQTLTALVSDSNGVPANVDFVWLADEVPVPGAIGSSFLVGADQVGAEITVTASYVDNGGYAEYLTSTPKGVSDGADGDFSIVLLNLSAPVGASTMNPLTTLVQNAISLGVSPGEAMIIIKDALGIAPGADLLHDEPWAVLQGDPVDAEALALEKKVVQVAVMTSLGGDESGMALTQAILLAHSNGTGLDLADTTVIANLLGLPFDDQVVHEIWDRNANISEAGSLADIEQEWADMQSGQPYVLSDSVGTLSSHINQAPTGTATATLAHGAEDAAYVIDTATLLQGFSDVDGGTLSVADIVASDGQVDLDPAGTSVTITPSPGYHGPVELTYSVLDGQGGSAPASQLYVIEAAPVQVNHAPTGSPSAVLGSGTEDTAYLVAAGNLLAGFSDVDGDTLSISNLNASDGAVVANGDGSFTVTPSANYHGVVTLGYDVVDGHGGSLPSVLGYNLAAVNDAPTGEVTIVGTAKQGQTLVAANTLSDADGMGSIGYQWLADGVAIVDATGDSLVLGPAQVDKVISVFAAYVDGEGTPESVTSTGSAVVLPPDAVNHAPVAGNDAAGTVRNHSITLNVLANDLDADNDGLSVSLFAATSVRGGRGVLNADGTLTYTPARNYLGADSFTYQVTDGQLESNVANVTVSVLNDKTVKSNVSTTLSPTDLDLELTGKDNIWGTGNDWDNQIVGNKGKNVLNGMGGDDRLDGGDGNDILIGGTGNDVLKGGSGKDTYRFALSDVQAGARDRVVDGKGDLIDLKAILASLTIDGRALNGLTHDVNVRRALDEQNSIAFDDGRLQIDLDGDGQFQAAVDFQIALPDVRTVGFDATTDLFMLG